MRTYTITDALDANPNIGLATFDAEFRFLSINQALADINGFSIAAHLGKTPGELLPTLAAEDLYDIWREVVRSGTPRLGKRLSAVTPWGSGSLRHFDEDYYPRTGGGIIAFVREVTGEYKVIETQALLEEVNALALALNAVTNVEEAAALIIEKVVDIFGAAGGALGLVEGDEIRLVSTRGLDEPTAQAWTHFPLAANVPMAEAARDRRPLFLEAAADLARFESAATGYESAVVLPLGSVATLGILFPDPRSFTGPARSMAAFLADLCGRALERCRLLSSLREAVEVRERMVGFAAHEIKTPLTSAMLNLEMIVDRGLGLGAERVQAHAEAAFKQLRFQQQLIEHMFDLTRLEAGAFQLSIAPADFARVAAEAAESIMPLAKRHGCELEVALERPIMGACDGARLKQVLLNLLSNAVRYAPGKPVAFAVRRENGEVCFSVADQGPGIPLEKQKAIFARYVRGDGKQDGVGLGVGLYLSNEVVRMHGGRIEVESAPGAGTRFTVRLPLRAEGAAPVPVPS